MGVRKGWRRLVLLVMFLSLLISPFGGMAYGESWKGSDSPEVTLDRQILRALEKDDYVEVLVKLNQQADTSLAGQKALLNSKNKPAEEVRLAQNRAVVNALREVAAKTQPGLIKYLESQKQGGHVKEYHSFYIVNALYVKADRETIEGLAKMPQVAEIRLDAKVSIELPEPEAVPFATASPDGVEWNISRVQADQVWEKLGIDGTGAVVGIIDSGVDWQHEALKEKWRGYNPADPSQPQPRGNWFDAVNGRNMPYDEPLNPHGTHVLGIILGQDKEGKNKIGVAPGAQWIAAKAFTALGGQLSWLLKAGEFMLAPAGDPALAPDVVNNSWGLNATADDWYREMVKAWRDAGIVPIFAAGNEYYLVSNPANYPESVAVGATDIVDKRAPFSNTGPGAYPEAQMKPDVMAPGMYVRSSVPGGYAHYDGTSMAAPHVAGVVALLRSADPSLGVEEIIAILKETATPLYDEQFFGVPNYGYGYGLVNAFHAVASVYSPEGLPVITQPAHGQYINEETTVVKGTVPQDGLVTIYVNGEPAVQIESRNKTFEGEVSLVEGRNELTATLTLDGVEGKPSIPVTVIQDLEPPFIQLMGLEEDLMLVEGDTLVLSFMTDSPLKRAELYLVEHDRAIDPLPFEDLGWGFYQVEWTVPRGVALSFAEAIVVVEDEAGNLSETAALGTVTVISDANRLERLSGANRYATAVRISQSGWRQADTVVIARGDHYADALAGVSLAHQYDAPILLTPSNSLPQLVADEIERLEAKRAIILGGEKAVSPQVEQRLAGLGLVVERVGGENRYDTARHIARMVAPLGAEQAVLASGASFADALAIGAFAAANHWPVLLTSPGTLSKETDEALADLGVQEVLLVGGHAAISQRVENGLKAKKLDTRRIGGKDRYATSVEAARELGNVFSHLYVTTGEDYADALTGAVLAAKRGTGLILVKSNGLPDVVSSFLRQHPLMKMDIIGGNQAVSPKVEQALKGRLVRY